MYNATERAAARAEQEARELQADENRRREEAEEVLPPALFAALFGADVDGPTIVRALTAAVVGG